MAVEYVKYFGYLTKKIGGVGHHLFCAFTLAQTGPLIFTEVGEDQASLHSILHLGQAAWDALSGGEKRSKQLRHLNWPLRLSYRAIEILPIRV